MTRITTLRRMRGFAPHERIIVPTGRTTACGSLVPVAMEMGTRWNCS
jgi:hypothetical protein